MKNIGTILAALFVAFVLVAYMCTFQVRSTEIAIVKTWGKPGKEAITEPGLKLKWPRPIQSVVVYDKRIRMVEKRTEETRTFDGKNVLLSTFALWRIDNPYKFDTAFPGGVEDGKANLRKTVETTVQAVVGKRSFDEFVSTDPSKRRLREIEREMLAKVAENVETQYGIKVVDFGIKKLGLPQSITTEIFNSMKATEEAKARTYVAEGEAQATGIVANAQATEDRIIAAAREKVAQIKAEGQRMVSQYYKEFEQHPELRIFLDTLRTNAEALQQRTTLILDMQQSPWNVFDERVRARIPLEGLSQDLEAALPETAASRENRTPETD